MTRPARDRAWLEALFDAHHAAVLAYARRRVPADDADDVLAEVFTAVWRHRDRVPDPALPWLYRTASHHVLHTWRSRRRNDQLSARLQAEPTEPLGDHADYIADQLDQNARVHRALALLTARDAEVLRLATWEQLPTDELAYVLRCTPTAAKVRLHRARRRFADALQPAATHPQPGSALPTREVTS